MSPQCRNMKGLFSPVTLSEHLQRRMGEHETSGEPIQSLWNVSSSLVVPMAVRQGATKSPLLCLLAGNGTCCFSFQMSFTDLQWGADADPPPQTAWAKLEGLVACDWKCNAFTHSRWDVSGARRFFKVHSCSIHCGDTRDRWCVSPRATQKQVSPFTR